MGKNSLGYYFNNLIDVNRISYDEEKELYKRIQNGEQKAKELLIEANLRFVIQVAKKYQNRGLLLDDLIAEGNIGMIEALKKFDPERGIKFISFAVWWIKLFILRAIYYKTKLIHFPLKKIEMSLRLQRENSDVNELEGRTEDYVREIEKFQNYEEVNIPPDGYIENDNFIINSIEEAYIDQDQKNKLFKLFNESLDEREKYILKNRFGWNNEEKVKPLRELGQALNLCNERIRQIEINAIKKLRRKRGSLVY